ncbi:MAG: hypothetical protein EBY14_13330 [Betaproteobacteria bacterium]|nr:hypothetical protein [Betaproteobacteria bacterium]
MDDKGEDVVQASNSEHSIASSLPFWKESIVTLSGRNATRIRSSLFYGLGILSIIAGILLVTYDKQYGTFFILNSSILFLYPLVRFLFGGKDSLVAFVWTIVLDYYLKSKLNEGGKGNRKRH